jgi:Transposase DDE domain group 1
LSAGASRIRQGALSATVVPAHSEEKAAPTWKKTYGFHPLAAFADHGAGAGGEPLAILLRPGNAGSSAAAEHIEVAKLALASCAASGAPC